MKKNILKNYAEVIILLILTGVTIGPQINYITLALFVLVLILLISQYRVLGKMIGIVFGLLSCYMLLALFSEFSEFPVVNGEALILLSVGLALISVAIFASAGLLLKYFRDPKH